MGSRNNLLRVAGGGGEPGEENALQAELKSQRNHYRDRVQGHEVQAEEKYVVSRGMEREQAGGPVTLTAFSSTPPGKSPS